MYILLEVGDRLPRSQASPIFFFFGSSVCVQYHTWKRKSGKKTKNKKKGRPGLIHHVNDIKWRQGGHRERGAQLRKQCIGSSVRVLYRISGLEMLAWSELLIF